MRSMNLTLISVPLWTFSLFAQTTPPDADLGQPVRITISDQDVARHMSPSERETWRRYVREGELLKQEVSKFEPGSPEHRAMQNAQTELKQEFRREFASFFGICNYFLKSLFPAFPINKRLCFMCLTGIAHT